jgi:16S rRNA U1498 N3-methylase RsmE
LYTFLNKEDDIPDLPKDDDDWPLGTWINASEVTSRESFEDIYKDSENESTVLVIVEDFKTNMAMATLEDGTTDSIRVSLDNVNINDVEKIVKEAFKQAGKTVTSVNNLSELKIAASFKMIISENTAFRNWMARSGYRFILVRTDDWNKGFP